jgi:hypothetical protein
MYDKMLVAQRDQNSKLSDKYTIPLIDLKSKCKNVYGRECVELRTEYVYLPTYIHSNMQYACIVFVRFANFLQKLGNFLESQCYA